MCAEPNSVTRHGSGAPTGGGHPHQRILMRKKAISPPSPAFGSNWAKEPRIPLPIPILWGEAWQVHGRAQAQAGRLLQTWPTSPLDPYPSLVNEAFQDVRRGHNAIPMTRLLFSFRDRSAGDCCSQRSIPAVPGAGQTSCPPSRLLNRNAGLALSTDLAPVDAAHARATEDGQPQPPAPTGTRSPTRPSIRSPTDGCDSER